MLDFLLEIINGGGNISLWLIFLLLIVCGLGLPIPEDIPIVVSGILISNGDVNFKHAMFVCMSGVLIGDSIIYFAGWKWGVRITKHKYISRIIKPRLIVKASLAFRKYGNKIIFIARFLPGFRAPIYFFVGMRKKPFWLFIAIDSIAAFISVPAWIFIGKIFGDNIPALEKAIKELKMGTILVILMLIGLYFVGGYLRKRFAARLEKEVNK